VLIVRLSAVFLVWWLAAGCATEPRATEPPAAEPRAASDPSVSPLPTTQAAEPPASNQRARDTGISLLRNGGVARVGEAEPPHGGSDALLWGRLRPDLVFATVRRTKGAELDGEVVDRQHLGGVEVQTVRGRDLTSLRFPYGAFTVDLRVTGRDDLAGFLPGRSRDLLSVILCPSECGDLPPGADG
jgi:hypothetical protein